MANSNVNIDRLTDTELMQRYVNHFKDLQGLRAQYEKIVKNNRSEKKQEAAKIALSEPPQDSQEPLSRSRVRNPGLQRSLGGAGQRDRSGLFIALDGGVRFDLRDGEEADRGEEETSEEESDHSHDGSPESGDERRNPLVCLK